MVSVYVLFLNCSSAQTPYFGNLRDLEVDRDKLKSSLVALKDAMLSLDQQRKEEVTGTKKTAKVVSLWK